MARLETVQFVNREAQTSDTAIYRKDLPKAGYISAIDIGIRVQNAATQPVNKEILDILNYISLVVNGSDYRVKVKGPDLFRYNWLKQGKPMYYNFDETASVWQEVWFRLSFGRYLGDPMYGLDLSKYNNVQLQLDYALSNFGTVGTHITTATFTPTIILHVFPSAQRPSFRGCLGIRTFYEKTSVASAVTVVDSPSQNPVLGFVLAAREDNIAEGTDISDIRIGFENLSRLMYNVKWYNQQIMNNANVSLRKEKRTLYLTNAATEGMCVANISHVDLHAQACTAGVA